MAIKSIELKNFTVFENIKCEFSPGINILIGENGTGKTHLLKVLFAVAKGEYKVNEGETEYHHTNWSSLLERYFRNKGYLSLHRNANNKIPYSISAECDTQKFCFTSDDHFLASYAGRDFAVLIPAKDMLTHARGLLTMAKKYSQDMPFDKTLLNIIEKAEEWKINEMQAPMKDVTMSLKNVIGGEIIQENGDFFTVKNDGSKIPFALEAEGIKKLGLLWLLIMNGNLSAGKTLFWDEPESNINPKLIPVVVDVLMELARNGVQVFLATHEYNLMKYFSVKNKDSDLVSFISLHKTDNGVACEVEEDYTLLENNSIVDAGIKLLEDEIEGVLGHAN